MAVCLSAATNPCASHQLFGKPRVAGELARDNFTSLHDHFDICSVSEGFQICKWILFDDDQAREFACLERAEFLLPSQSARRILCRCEDTFLSFSYRLLIGRSYQARGKNKKE